MATFMTQFHATLDELAEWIQGWAGLPGVTLTAFAYPPPRSVPITRDTIHNVLACSDVNDVVFTHGPIEPSTPSAYDATREHPGLLRLRIGRLGPRGLEQSALSTMDANPTWKKINADLKKKTKAGADFVHEENGVTGYERIFRFSPGAKLLSQSGTALRPFAQDAVVYSPK